MGSQVNIGGTWRTVENVSANIGGTWRTVVAGWTNVAGTWRKWFEKLKTVTKVANPASLSVAREFSWGASNGVHAIFAGGSGRAEADAYTSTLTKVACPNLPEIKGEHAGARAGNYALFACGFASVSSNKKVYAYSQSLTVSTLADYPVGVTNFMCGGYNGTNAIFAGGDNADTDVVVAYNSSLTQTTLSPLLTVNARIATATIGGYTLFAGGQSIVKTVETYNSSLVKGSATDLITAVHGAAGAVTENHALIVGGYISASPYYTTTVNVYSSTLVRSTGTSLSVARYWWRQGGGVTVDGTAIFGGGNGSSTSVESTVESFNKNLVRTTETSLSLNADNMACCSVGNYAVYTCFEGSGVANAYTVSY